MLEALLGAVFVDAGFEAAAAVVERLWGERLGSQHPAPRPPKTAAPGMGAGPRARAAVLQADRPRRHRARAGVPGRGQGGQPAAGAGRGPTKRDAESAARDPDARTIEQDMTNAEPHTRRLRRHRRRAQCRQVDAGQCAGRLEGLDRVAQGADHAHARDRHRHDRPPGGWRPRAGRAGRHAGHLPHRQAPARARHGRCRLAGRRGRRRRGPGRRCRTRRRAGDAGDRRAAEGAAGAALPGPEQDRPRGAREAAHLDGRASTPGCPSSAPSW